MNRNRRRNRFNRPQQESRERWLITYADMITLLMIFFIIMYTMSKVDAERFEALAESLHKVMGTQGDILYDAGPSIAPGTGTGDELTPEQLEQQNLLAVKKQLEAYLQAQGLQNNVSVTLEERGVVVSFQDVVLFPLGSAQLTGNSGEIVEQVGGILNQVNNYVRVEGHTDSLPINTTLFPSNWELSVARASRVVRELISTSGIDPERLSATGYGEYRPRMPNDVEENRRYNRRVDLVVLRNKFEEIEPGQEVKAQQAISSPDTYIKE